jgi:anti-sigma regulatory factor (Ser/Thr protein kinase)
VASIGMIGPPPHSARRGVPHSSGEQRRITERAQPVREDRPSRSAAAGGADRCRGVSPPALVRRVSARPDQIRFVREAIVAYAREHGARDPDAVALAVTEAVTNAVVHAYVDEPEPGDVEVIAQRTADDALEVLVCDDGRGMMPRYDSPGIGLGLPLAATLAERFEVEARPGGGTRVRMAFDAGAAATP